MIRHRHRRGHPGLLFEPVEPRVLLSADLLGLAGLPGTDPGSEPAPWEIDAGDFEALLAGGDPAIAAVAAPPDQADLNALSGLTGTAVGVSEEAAVDDAFGLFAAGLERPEPASTGGELVIIDTRVPEYQTLLEEIVDGRADRLAGAFLLDPERDGIAQIGELLQGRQGVSAVHLISHGNDGGVQLGATWLSGDNLDGHAGALAGWGAALAPDADLLLYGCDIAADSDGQALVELIAELTGADVAASTDLTGSASLGGDWQLEHHAGAIETAALAPADGASTWSGVLGAAPVGGEILVNQNPVDWAQSTFNATPNAVASDADGNFIVVWESDGQDGNNEGVYARLFNADGTPQGDELQVNSVWDRGQTNPAVAMNAEGAYVIVWQTDAYSDPDADKTDVYARLIDKDGNDSGELRVNSGYTADDQTDPAVTIRDDGSFVVTWTSKNQDGDREGIFAQRFDASGAELGGQILINNITPDKQLYPSIDSNAAGDFAVTWTGKDLDSGKLTVYARRFDADGAPQDKQFIADQFDGQDQQYSDLVLLDDGSLIVVWQSRNQDGGSDGIYARRFDADGDPLGDEFLVNLATPGQDESAPSVSADAAGNFVVTWTRDGADVYAREFDALGNPVSSGEVAVATAALDQLGAGVSMTGTGSYVVVYSGDGGGDTDGVFARRYQIPDPPAIDLNGADAGGDHSAAFVEDGGPVTIADAAADIAYAAGSDLTKLVLALTNPLDGTDEILSADTSDPTLDPGITAVYADGVLTISGTGAVPTADLVKVLRTVTYENTSQSPDTSDRVVRVLAADDSLLFGPSAYATVSVQAVNDAPVVTAPATATTTEDTPLSFTTGSSNAIAIADDAGAGDLEVRLDATHGTLSLTNRLGEEFRVNDSTSTDQRFAAVAVADDGRYVVVWEQNNGLDKEDVYARTYAADGSAISGDILVNSNTGGRQDGADVAIDANGNFVVVWEHDTENVDDKDDIHARTFDIDGVAYGNAVRVNAEELDDQLAPSVAMDPDGYFVVAWQSKTTTDGREIYVRPFDLHMNALVGADILVNTTPDHDQTSPDIAIKADGEFVVVWQSKDQDGSGEGIYLRRFDAAGSALDAGETLINASYTDDHQTVPSVAINDAGQTIVSWQSKGQDSPDNREGIYAQRYDFDSAGLVGGEIAVTTETDDDQKAPAVAIAGDGNFVVTWQSKDQDDDDGKEGVYLQEFAADGSRLRFETLVNSHTLEAQTAPAVGMAGDSQYVVVWQSKDQDPDGTDGIYGQRFQQPGALAFTLGDGIDDASTVFRGRVDNISAALAGLRFTPDADYYGAASLSISVDDLGHTGSGGAQSTSASVAITVDPVNDAPLLQTPQGTQQVAETVPFVFDAFNGTLITLSDVDADAAATPELELTLSVAHGILSADVAGAGVTVTAGANDSAGLTFRGTQAQLNAAIDGLVYTPDLAYLGADTLSLSLDDLGNFGAGGAQVTVDSIAINVFDYNVPPVNSVPLIVSTTEGTMFTFAGADRLEVIDHDAKPNDDVDVTLSVTHGLLSLPTDPGITVTGDWLGGAATLVLAGDKALVNDALDGLRYTPDAHFAGTATLQMTTSDQGHSGIDGIKTDLDLVTIQVSPDASNDAPTVTAPATVDTTEESPLVFSTVVGNAIQVSDDANDQPIRVKLTAADGTVSLSTTVGTQFQANSNSGDHQSNAAAAMTSDGGFVLVWQSKEQDDDGWGIFAQRYNADGAVLGAELKVNTVFHKHQTDPEVAVADDGSFVVVWVGEDQDGDNKGVFGQRFDANGERLGAEFQVNTYTHKAQVTPDVAMDAGGRFVVVWASDDQDGKDYGVYGQVFDAGGAKAGSEFQVNLTTNRHQQAPAVAMDDDGDFVVAWQSEIAGDNKWDIHARRFAADGTAKDAAELQVNSVTDETQFEPDVAMDAAGNFVVVWQSKDLDYPDGEFGIYQRRFDADGSPLTAKQSLVNTQVAKDQLAAAVAMDRDGDYVVAWQGENQDDPDGRFGVFVQRYEADGTARGAEFRANTTTVKDQRAPALAAGDDGRFVVAWESDGEDGSGYGVFGQLYNDVDGLSFFQGDGRDDAVVEFEAPLDEVNNVLDGLAFTPAVDFDGATTLTIEVDDLGHSGGTAQVSSAVTTVNVGPVNDAPSFDVPSPQRAYEDVPLIFSAANGNAIQVQDADAGSDPVSVSLTAYGGELSLAGTDGLTFATGDGSDDGAMRFSGSLTAINAALDGLAFRAAPGFAGVGSIQIGADDGGSNGSGGAQVNAAAVAVNVESDLVNDAPEIQLPGPQQTGKNVELRLSDLDGNAIVITDDALAGDLHLKLTVVNGTISLSDGLGAETQANTTTAGEQRFSSIAATSSGDQIAVWQSKGQDQADSEGIYAQRFNAEGRSVGFEIAVNQFTAGDQTLPVVAAAPSGEFAVAWVSDGQDGNGLGVFARKFDAYGNALSDELLVNTGVIGNQAAPAVAMDGNGAFVVVWEGPGDGDDLFLQRFDRNGVAVGAETLVNTNAPGNQELAAVAMDDAGNFIVAWQAPDANGLGIFAQRFDAAGLPVGATEFAVNTLVDNGDQKLAAVAMNAGGQFVVAWQGEDGSNAGIRASLFAADGTARREDFVVNAFEEGNQVAPAVAIADDGGFVVTWQSADAAGQGIYARYFDAAGDPIGGDLVANLTTAGEQTTPAVAVDDEGTAIVSWTSDNQDGDKEGVYVQRLIPAGAVTWNAGTGENDGFIDVEGTPEQINGLLNGLVFTPTNNFEGEARIDIAVDDQGNTGAGGALSAAESLTIMVNKPLLDLDADDSSGAAGADYQAYFTPGGSEVAILDDDLVISTPEPELNAVTIVLTNRPDAASEWLSVDTGGFLAIDHDPYDAAIGELRIYGRDSIANYQTVLASVRYHNSAATPDASERQITVQFEDRAGDLSNVAEARVLVDQQPPVLSLYGELDYTEGDPAALVVDSVSVSDPDTASFGGGRLSIDMASSGSPYDRLAIEGQAGGVGEITLSGSDIAYNFGGAAGTRVIGSLASAGPFDGLTPIVVDLTADADAAAVEALIGRVSFANLSDDPATNLRAIRFVLEDGEGAVSETASATVRVANLPSSVAAAAESFDYSAGGLAGGNGGSGWSGAWQDGVGADGDGAVAVDSVVDTTGLLYTDGGRGVLIDGVSDAVVYRNLNEALGGDGTEAWLGFVLRPDSPASFADGNYGGLVLGGGAEDGAGGLFIGHQSGNVGMVTAGGDGGSYASGIGASEDAPLFLAAHLDFRPGNDVFTLYVNPTPGSQPGNDFDADRIVFKSNLDLGSFTQVALLAGEAAQQSFDEIRVGESYAAVSPVTAPNGLPVIDSGLSFTVSEAAAVDDPVGTVTAQDPDPADTLQNWTIVSGNGDGVFQIDPVSGAVSIADTALLDFESTASYTLGVRVSDGANTSATGNVDVSVVDVNEAPVLDEIGNQSVDEGATLSFTATATDSDLPGDTLSFGLDADSIAMGMSIDPSTGAFSWKPSEAQGGLTPSVTITVTDDGTGALSDAETFTISVNDLNSAPVITSDGGGASAAVNLLENRTAVTTVTAADIDEPVDTLSYTIAGGADSAWFTLDPATGALRFDTAPDFESPTDSGADNSYEVAVQVSDGVDADTQTLTVTIEDIANETGPLIDGATVVAAEDAANAAPIYDVDDANTGGDTDSDGEALSYRITAGNADGVFAIDPATGVISVLDNTGLDHETVSRYTLTVEATDGLNIDSADIVIDVGDVNDAPTITSNGGAATAAVSVSENNTAVTTVTAADADVPADTLTYAISGGADAGRFSLDPASGELTFVAAPDFENPDDADVDGVYQVEVQVGDGTETDTQLIQVTVGDVNDAPTLGGFADAVAATDEDTAVEITFGALLSASDAADDDGPVGGFVVKSVDSGSLRIGADAATAAAWAAGGNDRIDAANRAFWTPGADEHGPRPAFVAAALDSSGAESSGTATALVTVRPINDAPAFTSGPLAAATEGRAYSCTVSTTDADGDPLTLTGASLPAWLSLTDNGDGTATLSGTPGGADVGAHSVLLRVSDGTLAHEQDFTVTVEAAPADTTKLTTEVDLPAAPVYVAEPKLERPTEPSTSERDKAEGSEEAAEPEEGEEEGQEVAEAPPVGSPEDPALVPDTALPPETTLDSSAVDRSATDQGSDRPDFRVDRLAKAVDAAVRADWLNAGELLLEGLQRGELVRQFEQLLASEEFRDGLDRVRGDMEGLEFLDRTAVATSMAATTSLSVGYVAWLLRGGVLLSTVLSSMPAWNLVDPLPVLASTRKVETDGEDDSLEDIIKKRRAAVDDNAVDPAGIR